MISKENYTKEHIEYLRSKNGSDPILLERTIYAFGLLEAIKKTGLDFIFKGGTSLLLLLDTPQRLSTDIDIIVKPNVDINKYIKEAGKIFPFLSYKEDIRKGRNNIEKRHYKFQYESPISNKPFNILLDVLFEENPYTSIVNKELVNSLLLSSGDNLTIQLPDSNSILGDKLTAFAPHTTGIPLGVNKELEIIKQMYDCYTLFNMANNYEILKSTYKNVVNKELEYRGLNLNYKDVLLDTINACLCIISRGAVNKEEYKEYLSGINKIQGHIINNRINGELAGEYACSVLYLASCLYKNVKNIKKDIKVDESITIKNSRSINYIKLKNKLAYSYIVESYNLLSDSIIKF